MSFEIGAAVTTAFPFPFLSPSFFLSFSSVVAQSNTVCLKERCLDCSPAHHKLVHV